MARNPAPPLSARRRVPRRVSGIGFQVGLGFAIVVVLLAGATLLTARMLSRAGDARERAAREEEVLRTTLLLTHWLREGYTHEDSVLLEADSEHHRYGDALTTLETWRERVRDLFTSEADRVLLEEIEGLANGLMYGSRTGQSRGRDDLDRIVHLMGPVTDRLAARIRAARSEADLLSRRAASRAIGLFVLAAALAAAVSARATRSVARPVRALLDGVRRIGGGDLSTRVQLARGNEFGALADGINRMAADLGDREERLVQAEKTGAIGRVAAGVAHEMNNPLQVALGTLKLLLRRAPDGEMRADLDAIGGELEMMRKIVEDLLETARPVRLSIEPLDLVALARQEVERQAGNAQAEGPELDLRAPAGEVVVEADEARLKQVLRNLLRNAVQAAGKGGHVAVRILCPAAGDAAAAGTGRVDIEVEDDGPGVKPEDRSRLFEPFFSTRAGGVGLGLALSRALVQAHGGSLDYAPGSRGGARFRVRLHGPSSAERRRC